MIVAPPFPVTMRGDIDRCVLVSLATPARSVQRLVPRGLRLLERAGINGERFAFWNVVLCHIDSMRPSWAPPALGVSYHHVAHRLMVEADDGSPPGESPTQGLYFVRSDADSTLVCLGGNLVSDFRFHAARVERVERGGAATAVERWRVRSRDHHGDLDAAFSDGAPTQPEGSPFASLAEARAFLKYRPFGVSPGRAGRRLRLAEVFREEAAWDERPVVVDAFRSGFLASIGQEGASIELAVRVAPIAYRWRLGRTVPTKSP